MRTPIEAQQHAISLLVQHGIDPNRVALHGYSDLGYRSFVFAEDGRRAIEGTGGDAIAVTDWADWPPGFPVEEFLAAANEWKDSL